MNTAPRKRMTREQRREQLLEVATTLLRHEGSDALTLVTLARHAGVDKPVVYSQFTNRQGLLAQLYECYDAQVVATIQGALKQGAGSLEDAAQVVAMSYIDAFVIYGAEYEAVVSALMAYPEYADLTGRIMDYFVRAFGDIFQPFIRQPDPLRSIHLTMMFGAVDQTARAVASGRLPRDAAVKALTEGLVTVLGRAVVA